MIDNDFIPQGYALYCKMLVRMIQDLDTEYDDQPGVDTAISLATDDLLRARSVREYIEWAAARG